MQVRLFCLVFPTGVPKQRLPRKTCSADNTRWIERVAWRVLYSKVGGWALLRQTEFHLVR